MPKSAGFIKKISKKTGVYLGGVLVLITLIAYLFDWDLFLSPWFQFSKFLVIMVFAIYASLKAKKHDLNRRFSFRDGFSSFVIPAIFGLAIFTLFNWLLFNYIAPDAGHYVDETSINLLKERLQGLDVPENKIKEATSSLKGSYQFSFLKLLQGYVINLVLYCIPASIIALIFKSKKPLVK